MAHYMLRWQLSSASTKGFVTKPQDRTGPARELIEGFKGKLLSYYFSLGDYDGLAICEFPDLAAVSAASLVAASTGAFTRFETTPLLTAQEAEAVMKKAHAMAGHYKAPNA